MTSEFTTIPNIKSFRIVYPDGGITEFEAQMADPSFVEGEEPEGFGMNLPLTIVSPVRVGSIYDREGAD